MGNLSHSSIPDLIRLGQQAVRIALARCAAFSRLPYLVAVDGTCGNGHDTLFLAEALAAAGKPHVVLAFDIQPAALETTRARLEASRLARNVRLLLQNHARLTEELSRPENRPATLAETATHPQANARREAEAIQEDWRTSPGMAGFPHAPLSVATAMYNLGFLPRSDKRVITRPEHTLASLASAADALIPRGILVVHAYGGHPGGLEELAAVEDWCAALAFDEWTAARYTFCNKSRNPEVLFLVEKRERP